MDKFFDTILAFLKKLGTLVADRRLLTAVLAVLGLLASFGYAVDISDVDVEEALQSTEGALVALGVIVSYAYAVARIVDRLLESWSFREPSGLAPWRKDADKPMG